MHKFKRTVKFICVKCGTKVFRVTPKVNLESKLCSNCNAGKIIKPVEEPEKKTNLTVDDVFKTVNPEIEPVKTNSLFDEEIAGKIRTYQLLLSRVVDLLLELKPDHNETFLTLWLKAKEELHD